MQVASLHKKSPLTQTAYCMMISWPLKYFLGINLPGSAEAFLITWIILRWQVCYMLLCYCCDQTVSWMCQQTHVLRACVVACLVIWCEVPLSWIITIYHCSHEAPMWCEIGIHKKHNHNMFYWRLKKIDWRFAAVLKACLDSFCNSDSLWENYSHILPLGVIVNAFFVLYFSIFSAELWIDVALQARGKGARQTISSSMAVGKSH